MYAASVESKMGFGAVILNYGRAKADRDMLTVIGEHITTARCGSWRRAEGIHFRVVARDFM